LAHVTVVGNTAGHEGSAGYGADSVALTYKNSIVEGTCAGSATVPPFSQGYNIESPGNTCGLLHPMDITGVTLGNLGLGPLQDNGGLAQTHAPLSSASVAYNAVPAAACTDLGGSPLFVDQRDMPRPDGLECDAGAVEGTCPDCSDVVLCSQDKCDPGLQACSNPSVVCPTDDVECTGDVCDPATGLCNVTDGTLCESGIGQCISGVCDLCAEVTCPDDGNECTVDVCDWATGACYQPRSNGASCAGGAGQCVDGVCDLCGGVTCPDDGNECTDDVCDPATGTCSPPVPDGTPCDSGNGECVAGVCDHCAGVTCPDDGNECTSDACDPLTGTCPYPLLPDGTLCDSGNGECLTGECDLCPGLVCDLANPDCPCGWTNQGESGWYAGRSHHAMAYISDGQCVMFAGGESGQYQDIWRYNVTTNVWLPGGPSNYPPIRWLHGMAHVGGDKVLMFGGEDQYIADFADTWVYDLSDDNWVEHFPPTHPSARTGHGMVYVGDDKVVLFGGHFWGSNSSDETWVYDLSDDNWTLKSPVTNPAASSAFAMARIGGDKALLFSRGGDTWVYDLSDDAWQLMSPSSSPMMRFGAVMEYLGEDKAVLFGGYGPYAGDLGIPLEDTWLYDLSDNTWTQHTDWPHPGTRFYLASCETSLDASSPVVIFGGRVDWVSDPPSKETWSFAAP
jgi:hypothetical protein